MKVSLITLHNVKNYGSALQTYATQTTLKKFVDEVEIINYYRKDLVDENLLKNRINNSKIFSKNIFTRILGKMLLEPSINKQCIVFNKFLNEYINLTTERYYSNEDLINKCPKADIYCTGSDQVWNSDWNKGIEKPFFLDFLPENSKRIAYAASFGKSCLDEYEKEELKRMLKKYEKISVREKTALDILKDLGINSAEHVLDPTLLLKKEDWLEITKNINYKGKYILVYQLNSYNPKFDRYVKKLSKNKKMPIIRVSNVLHQKFKYGKLVFCPEVIEFLGYFINAEYIVTDSFHGTGFSINFNKKFLCIFPEKFSTRLQSILELTGLTDRRVVDFDNFDKIDEEIDYKRVNKIIGYEREKSLNFLKDAIESCRAEE